MLVLWVTDSCLQPEKCTWFMITSLWDKDRNWCYGTKCDSPFGLIILDNKQQPHVIEHKEIKDGVKGLDLCLKPSGVGTTQTKRMLDYSKNGHKV